MAKWRYGEAVSLRGGVMTGDSEAITFFSDRFCPLGLAMTDSRRKDG